MARTPVSDLLQVHRFHLLDVDWSLSLPPFVFLPMASFSAITMPELTIGSTEIREGTSDFTYKVLDKASTNTITLSKGVSAFNSDFWRWTVACLQGNPPKGSILDFLKELGKSLAFMGSVSVPGKRRNMALLHLSGIQPSGLPLIMKNGGPGDIIKAAALMPVAAATAITQVVAGATAGLVDFSIASIPAKVYILVDCLPTRYKPGSDFDAATSAVSIEELDLSFSSFEEFALTA